MRTRDFTIIAQDPSIKDAEGKIIKTTVQLPYEDLNRGPRGHRVHIIDYDSSQKILYKPADIGNDEDPFRKMEDEQLLDNVEFHAQNVYAIVMRLLNRFEFALGRRISWGFGGHQLHIAPHAFADANAYYSEEDQGLFFGYFTGEKGNTVYTCLSHDIVAHETTHALVDGLRKSYILPSLPDQAGFHEGFADSIALLSVFGLRDIVKTLLLKGSNGKEIKKRKLSKSHIKNSVLLGLASQFGEETSNKREDCLRRSVKRPPNKEAYKEFKESHLRGEILSAAILNSFVDVWVARLKSWFPRIDDTVQLERVVEDASDAANHLITICIRALDYCPVIDITYSDFLSAILTADFELLKDDGRYKYREIIRRNFKNWGIEPSSGSQSQVLDKTVQEIGIWEPPYPDKPLNYDSIHREPLEIDRNEVFRFLWDNRKSLGLFEEAFTWVLSVRPSTRIAPDGIVLRETIAEYRQILELEAGRLHQITKGIEKPKDMPGDVVIRLNGGGILVFNDFGRLKYHIRSKINNEIRQTDRLDYLWRYKIHNRYHKYGYSDDVPKGQRFANMHHRRNYPLDYMNEWAE